MRCGNTRTPYWFTMSDGEVYATFNRQDLAEAKLAATPFAGLLTMEWRRGRPIAVVGGIVIALFGIYMGSMILIKGNDGHRIIGFIPPMVGFCGFLMGMMVALDWIGNHKRPGLRPFIAALPFSDRSLACAILWTLARGLIVSIPVSLCGLLISVIVYSVFVASIDLSAISHRIEAIGPAGVVTVAGAAIAMAWAISGIVATMTATGSLWAHGAAYVIICGVLVSVFALDRFGGPTGRFISALLQVSVGTAVLFATIVCFVRARQQELIAGRTVTICCTVGAALTFAIGTTLANDLRLQFMGLCFAALTVVSFASLPLAVRWNRHR